MSLVHKTDSVVREPNVHTEDARKDLRKGKQVISFKSALSSKADAGVLKGE